jgi:hypothetical protein
MVKRQLSDFLPIFRSWIDELPLCNPKNHTARTGVRKTLGRINSIARPEGEAECFVCSWENLLRNFEGFQYVESQDKDPYPALAKN